MTSHGNGGGVLVNVQEWGRFSIFRRVDDVKWAMSKVGLLVNVQEWGCLSIFRRADDVTWTMSNGGGVCECLHPPPPLQEILYPRLHTIRAQPPLHMFLLSRMGIVCSIE